MLPKAARNCGLPELDITKEFLHYEVLENYTDLLRQHLVSDIGYSTSTTNFDLDDDSFQQMLDSAIDFIESKEDDFNDDTGPPSANYEL